jgi:thioredoxin 1
MKQYKTYKDLGETNIPSVRKPPPPPENKVFDHRTMTMKQSQQTVPNSNASKLYNREMYNPPDKVMNPPMNQQFMENAPVQPPDAAVHIENADHKSNLIQSHRIAVIDCYGDFCQPCKVIAPAYEELAKKYRRDGICVLAKEDVKLGLSNEVRGVPTFFIYKDGNVVDKVVGADLTSEDGVEQKLLNVIQTL